MIKQKLRSINLIINNRLYINNKNLKTNFLKHINLAKSLTKDVNMTDFKIIINDTFQNKYKTQNDNEISKRNK